MGHKSDTQVNQFFWYKSRRNSLPISLEMASEVSSILTEIVVSDNGPYPIKSSSGDEWQSLNAVQLKKKNSAGWREHYGKRIHFFENLPSSQKYFLNFYKEWAFKQPDMSFQYWCFTPAEKQWGGGGKEEGDKEKLCVS